MLFLQIGKDTGTHRYWPKTLSKSKNFIICETIYSRRIMIITLRDGLASERACQQRGRTGALYIRGDKSCESVNRGISFFRDLSVSEIAELLGR